MRKFDNFRLVGIVTNKKLINSISFFHLNYPKGK